MNNTQILELARSLSWLKQVAVLSDDDIKRWSPDEWNAWHHAMHAPHDGDNPSVPDWMNPLIRGMWHNDFSFPFPQVGQLLPTAHPWFMEAMRHDDFSLRISEPEDHPHPQLSQIEAVYNEALLREWTPLMAIVLAPTRQHRVVVGAIEAFYIVAPAAASDDAAELLQAHDLPDVTRNFVGPSHGPAELLQYAGLPPADTDVTAWGSEWLYHA